MVKITTKYHISQDFVGNINILVKEPVRGNIVTRLKLLSLLYKYF